MNTKNKILFLIIIGLSFSSLTILAGPPHHSHHHYHYYDRGYRHYYHGHRSGSDGVWLAAGIVNLVGNGLNILNNLNQPSYVYPYPQQRVIIQQPPQPIYITPPPQPQIIYQYPTQYSQPIVIYR